MRKEKKRKLSVDHLHVWNHAQAKWQHEKHVDYVDVGSEIWQVQILTQIHAFFSMVMKALGMRSRSSQDASFTM